MTAWEAGWLTLGALAVAALWYAVLRKHRDVSESAAYWAQRREWREGGSDVDHERINLRRTV